MHSSAKRLVLDTNVALSAVLSESAPSRLIELATEGEIELFSSAELNAEFAEVLDREHVRRGFERKRRSAQDALASYSALVESIPPPRLRPAHRTPTMT
jgi:uncharacterized protein